MMERLREGFGCEIARQKKPTERRVRQIVAEALEGREALEGFSPTPKMPEIAEAQALLEKLAPDPAQTCKTGSIPH